MKFAIRGSNGLAQFVHVLHGDVASPGAVTQANLDAFAIAFFNIWTARMKSLMSANGAYQGIDVTLYLGGESVKVSAYSASVAGTLTGTELPSSACCVVSWRTASDGYRGGHSRTYLPTPTTGQMGNVNQWTTTYANAVANQATGFLTDCATVSVHAVGDFTFGVLRRVRNKVILDPPEFKAITSAHADPRIDTQRRRLGH